MLKSQNIPALIPGEAYAHFSRTQFDLSSTQLTFEQAKQAYGKAHFEEAVSLYTQVVVSLQTNILSTVLVHRAAAYEMLQQYDQALQDSKSATDASSHVDGYLAEASAYYFQHKPGRAVATYKKALTQWPQHTLISKKHDQIIKETDEHNQWIVRKLPYEILSRILSLASIHDHIQLAKTSRFWYRFMMHDWPDMWNKIDARTDLPTRSPAIYRFLEQVPRHKVRNVILEFQTSEDDYDRPRSLTPATFGDIEADIHVPATLDDIFRSRRPRNRRNDGVVSDPSKVMFEWMLAKKWNCIETLAS
ncbi:hypothetical protein BJV82DRAFT_624708 [Fennellomyces sp. T-0311]|nr:hypothetical protein BJV82DRAFT_624708 [Fennellomyces sp. T-0311]